MTAPEVLIAETFTAVLADVDARLSPRIDPVTTLHVSPGAKVTFSIAMPARPEAEPRTLT